jgi:glycosyltransferase involved in cell wall biosynthesis
LNIDAIVCISEPNFEILWKCFRQLEKQLFINKIFVVHPYDEEFVSLQENIISIREPKKSCLANARRLGIKQSKADFICFVDADVILHTNHFKQLINAYKIYSKVFNKNNIVIEGVLNNIEKSQSKFSLPYFPYQFKFLKLGERGFTHNTLIPRKYVLDWNPPFTCAFEDYDLTQHVFSKNGKWVRFVQQCKSYHIKDYGIVKRSLWGTAGERIVINPPKKTIILRGINYIKRAIIQPFLLKNVNYFIYNMKLAYTSIIGYFAYNKYIHLQK